MNKKILIVDDEPGIVELLSLRFKAKGYEVFVAFDGSQCVTIAEEEVPDLILTDIRMPVMDGITAFEKIIKMDITKEIPFIFMTAYPNLQIQNQVASMGAKGFISKPLISEYLELIVESVIHGRDIKNEYQNIDRHTYHQLNR